MYYAPHTLLKRTAIPPEKDKYNRPIPGTGSEVWEHVCRCRCDDDTTRELSSDNAETYRSSFHIVAERNEAVRPGDYVRCMEGGTVRGEGKVGIVKRANLLGYSEYWV